MPSALPGGRPLGDDTLQNCVIDIGNNDISDCSGDAIELDYGVHNLRALRNRIVNCYGGISLQPVIAGMEWRNVQLLNHLILGRAPDLGAYELGNAAFAYGPSR